jgi:hypothetical protein
METIMRKIALLGASALVLAIGAASASAQPSTEQLLAAGQAGPSQATSVSEGRAAATAAPAADAFIYQPHFGR